MSTVGVIGAGIAGLTAAYRLRSEGHEPVVLESEDRTGGVIRSEHANGFLVEHGPNSIQSNSPLLDELIERHDLEESVVRAGSAARNRYIVRDGRLEPAPLSPMKLVGSGLFGRRAKLRLLREPFVPPRRSNAEESVASFIRRRLGTEFLEYGMNPFIAGVYAGDPEQLSVRHALPALYEMEQTSGSIIKGQMDTRSGATSAAETHRMYSFAEGLERLPAAIASSLGSAVRTDAPVGHIAPEGHRWSINSERFDAVICTAPLHRFTDIHIETDLDPAALENVVYAPLSVVALGYHRADVQHSLDGFGMLVPEVEREISVLGTLFTSSIFPARAPEDHVLLTSFVGGMRHSEQAGWTDDELYSLVHADLKKLLSISSAPVFRRRIHWAQAIPQYNVGYGDVLSLIDRLEDDMPGFFMAGNFRRGISVGDAADSGDGAARRCTRFLASA